MQSEEHPEGQVLPVDDLASPHRNPIEYFIHCLETGEQVTGPLDPDLCLVAQRIVDTAMVSSREKRTVGLLD